MEISKHARPTAQLDFASLFFAQPLRQQFNQTRLPAPGEKARAIPVPGLQFANQN